jgi:tetratricopeptide (TPR) repeat protein
VRRIEHFVRIPLPTRQSRVLSSATVLLASLSFVAVSLGVAAMQALAGSTNIRMVRSALVLDPHNPELHYQAGLLELLQTGDTASAAVELRRAVQLNPRPARYWLALGQACFALQDHACAAESFERAVREAPMRPGLEWQAAGYYAAVGDARRFSAHAARLLELQPEAASLIFVLAWETAGAYDPG